ncbi:MAG TPA: S46 family peptidase, partial [Fimbriiglobus sp.]|nr:S46 family peptidase [Fimbriiglobus sp.]
AAAALVGTMLTAPPTFADEGMWLFNAPPLSILKERYGFTPDQRWLDHVRLSSVRFNSGGSGSFVSPDGLVLTNHHVGADDLQKLSTPEKNYLRDGFHARTRDQELKCKGLELNVLQSIKIVTDEVNAAVKPDMKPAEAFQARQAKIAEIEKANADPAKNIRADVVTLYAGGQYHLYVFKKYTDIRIVFAPEKAIAFFGGDPDNFEYPRYDLDICFMRVYEDDKPIQSKHYLKWSPNGSRADELIFVSGHPGRTNRQNTMAELKYLRDTGFPALMARLYRLEVLIGAWVERSAANQQRGEDELFGIQNSRKARKGGLAGLLDPSVMGRKAAEQKRLRDFIAKADAPWKAEAAKAFEVIAEAEKVRAKLATDVTMYENGAGFNSHLFGIARTLVRAAEEKTKPAGERLREFADARLPSLEFQLFADEPIYDDFETLKLGDSLTALATTYGADNELVKKVLAGKSPRERAYELVSGTKIKDVDFRKKLYEGGQAAIDAANDPMIALVKLVDPKARAVRKEYETKVEEPKRQAYAALAKARYALDGTNTYPDATFTLRLAFGTVKGYQEQGQTVPPYTTFAGLYERSKEQGNRYPFELPPRWEQKRSSLDLSTPLNFVSTADIIGGNSGSPVINKNAEVVGLIFDGNIQSLVLDFIYTQEQARAVSVDSRAIVEGLRKVYDAGALADELQGKK